MRRVAATILFLCWPAWLCGGELQQLKPLPKHHLSFYGAHLPKLILSPTPEFREVVRICGSVPVSVFSPDDVIRAANSFDVPAAINYSPWPADRVPATKPAADTVERRAEIGLFGRELRRCRRLLQRAPVAILIDDENMPGTAEETAGWRNQLYDVARDVFTSSPIYFYGYGERLTCAAKEADYTGWCVSAMAPPIKSDAWSVSLYAVPHRYEMREQYRRTCAAAGDAPVIPWIALGCGYHPDAANYRRWVFDWIYTVDYDYLLGAEINIRWFGDRPERFAPWGRAPCVVFYPGILDPRVPRWMEHFAAYCKGATGVSLGAN